MHCIHHITPTISEMKYTIFVSTQRLYWWSQTNCLSDITPTLRLPCYALYTMSHPLFMTSHHCSYHISSTAFMTSHTLYMTSYAGNTNLMSAIWPTIFNTTSTVSGSSHPLYWWYHTNWILEISSAIYDDIISIVYDITATESVSSHPPFQRYNSLCM